jgi:CRP-like cAMP-binding protein
MDYPLSAQALEDTVICGFDKNSFDKLVLKHPEIGLKQDLFYKPVIGEL